MKSGSPSSTSFRGIETTPRMGPSASLTRTGNLMKLGDGLMNRSWNHRYFVLRGSTLQYFTGARDSRPREVIDLIHAEVVWIGEYMDRPNCIYVEPLTHRALHLSGITLEESKQWMRWFQEAADPQAYHDLPPVSMQSAAANIMDRENTTSSSVPAYISPNALLAMSTSYSKPALLAPLKVPPNLPSEFTEPAYTMERVVSALESNNKPAGGEESWGLVDVVDGVRIFSSFPKTITSRLLSHENINTYLGYLLLGFVVVISLPKAGLVILIAGCGAYLAQFHLTRDGKRHMKSSSLAGGSNHVAGTTVIDVSCRGCLNWILDASKFSAWIPQVDYAFVNPAHEGGDVLHLVNPHGGHIKYTRHWWGCADGTLCVVLKSAGITSSWCIRPKTANSCRVWFTTSSSESGHVLSALAGLNQISHQYGDHDGSGIPRLNGDWVRHWKGGLTLPAGTGVTSPIDGKGIWKLINNACIFGTRRLVVNGVFSKSTEKSPLEAIASLFVGLVNIDTHHHSNQSVLRSVFTNLINSLYSSGVFMASTGWAKHHPRSGENLLCWLGSEDRSPQVFLEVIESSRPGQGMFSSARISITGHSWTLKGTVKYSIMFNENLKNGAMTIILSNSDIALELISGGKESKIGIVLPNLVVGVPNDNRIFWEGLIRVAQYSGAPMSHNSTTYSIAAQIEEKGDIFGSVLNESGVKVSNIDGNWLENIFIDNELVWTMGVSTVLGSKVVLKKAGGGTDAPLTASPKRSAASRNGSMPPRMSSADEEVVSFLTELRKEMPELLLKKRFDDAYLFRFAKARHFNMQETVKMLKQHVDWIDENDVENSRSFVYSELPQVKLAFPHGYHGVDKLGRPIYISRLGKTSQEALFQVTDWDRFIKFWIQSYEELLYEKVPACKAAGAVNPILPGLPPPSALASIQTVTILDIKGVGLSHLSAKAREFMAVTSKISANNYPEILGTMYVVNAPGIFSMIWNQVKSMVDPGTRAKMHILNTKQTTEKLLEVIDADQLPAFLGGECKCDAHVDGDESEFGCLSSDIGPWKIT